MKRLLTLFVLLALFLGAKAEWNQVYTIDYSTYRGFPFYVMGYVPEFDNGCMTDYGAMYGYKTDDEMEDFTGGTEVGTVTTQGGAVYHKVQLDEPAWHQYFIADNIQTKLDGKYKVVAKVKASAACSAVIQMRWNWGEDPASISVAIPDSADFQKVEWEYSGIGGTSCSLIAQPGSCTETIEWLSITVYEWQRETSKPIEWIEDLTNGDAENSWADLGLADVKYDDMENNFKVCAWARTKGRNLGSDNFSYWTDGGENWNPFPADIETVDGDNVFVVHAAVADTEGDASAWDNEFWIQSKHAWKTGTTLKIKFRYKCDYPGDGVKTNTQIHKQAPKDYLIWHAIGDITFTKNWQTFDGTMTIADDMAGGWSIAFNLNSYVKDAVNFYFDDLSWQYMKLDEGYFLAGINQNVTDSYDDLENAIQFEAVDDYNYVATIGEEGKKDTYVDQLMVSTTRGDDSAFKGATLKPQNKITNDAGDWNEYVASANAKLNVPGLGVWKVYLDTEYTSMAFEMLEGIPYEDKDPILIYTNPTEVVVHGQERDWLPADADGNPREDGIGEGQPWDNQFFLYANRKLTAGEVTRISFHYKANREAKTTTQCHGEPGAYLHWAAIGDVNFMEEWQLFEREFTVPEDADGMQCIAFNMAEIKDACDYYIKNVQWSLYDASLGDGYTYENLISAEGTDNFYVKEGAGTSPYIYNGESGNDTWTIAGVSELMGSSWDVTDTSNDMTPWDGGYYYTLTKTNVYLEGGKEYEYKAAKNHSWDENVGGDTQNGGPNALLMVGESGYYNITFTLYPYDRKLSYTTERVAEPVKFEGLGIAFDDYNGRNFYENEVISNNGFDLTFYNSSGKMYVREGQATFGTPETNLTFNTYLRVSRSNESNYLQLNIPYNGMLRVYARSTSTAATNRTLVLTQNGDTLYNKVVQDADAQIIEKVDEWGALNTMTYYPVIEVPVAANTVDVTFPTGTLNIYGFELVEGALEVPEALEIISNLAEGEVTAEYYRVKGVVTEIQEISTTYGNATFKIASPDSLNQTLLVYRCYGFNGEKITDENILRVNDEVTIYGQLQNYKGTPETKQGAYLINIYRELTPADVLAQIAAQITVSEAAIENLTYPNVPGASILKTTIEGAKAATEETGLEELKHILNELVNQTNYMNYMDSQYKSLAELMERIETAIQNNPNADAALVIEATNKIQEARTALDSGSYDENTLWNIMDIMNQYYEALSKVYLTIDVAQEGTLRQKINELGFEPSNVIGLTISGTLNWDDMNVISEMYNIEKIDMAETNVTEIWGYMFSGRPLKTVVLPKNLQRINYYAFAWCSNLKAIELPANLQYLEYNIFEGCYNLKSITYNSILPLTLNDQLMNWDYASQCTLYVPAIAVSTYQSSAYWNWFQIVGTDVMPEDIFIARNITLDWPEGLGTSVKPNVTIGYSEYNGTIGSLTLNGNSTVSMSNFNMLWSPRRSSYSTTYDDATGTYSWYRYAYGSLVANAPMRADNVSVSLETNTYRWDFLTFPFDVKVSDIINQQQTNAPLVIRRYDGKNRADGKMGETWVDMTPDMTLEAGKGYIWQSAEGDQGNSENNFTVTALDNAKKNNLFTTGDVTVELDEFISEFSQNRSWNLIGNPYPAFYDIRGMQTAAPITIWNGYNNVYQAYVPGEDDYILNPGQAFFIQRPLDQETLTFIKEGRQADLGIRNWDTNSTRAAANKERYVFNLILSGSEEVQGDRTRIVFDATAKADYEAGHDASKFMSPEASAAQIFTTNGDVRYAINVRPAMDGIVELGLSIGTAGSYTIALNTNVENEVYLIDRLTGMETRIDGGSTYTFQATKGISEGRFAVRFGNGEVTGIKAIASDSKDSDNWYNLKGQRVNAPTKGLYIQNGKKTVVK